MFRKDWVILKLVVYPRQKKMLQTRQGCFKKNMVFELILGENF